MTADIVSLEDWAERRARRLALDHLEREEWLPDGVEALISLMGLPAGENGEATAMRLRGQLLEQWDLGLIERVARRMLPVANAPSYEKSEEAFERVTYELGVGREGGLSMSAEQWHAVWRRVREITSHGGWASG